MAKMYRIKVGENWFVSIDKNDNHIVVQTTPKVELARNMVDLESKGALVALAMVYADEGESMPEIKRFEFDLDVEFDNNGNKYVLQKDNGNFFMKRDDDEIRCGRDLAHARWFDTKEQAEAHERLLTAMVDCDMLEADDWNNLQIRKVKVVESEMVEK